MHFQYPPAAETKFMRCTRGAILDIIVDLRSESPTDFECVLVELNEENMRGLYVPECCAHDYQVLLDGTDTSYQVGEFYAPQLEGTTIRISVCTGRCRRPWSPRPTGASGSFLKRKMSPSLACA